MSAYEDDTERYYTETCEDCGEWNCDCQCFNEETSIKRKPAASPPRQHGKL